jgi:type IV pilus assembly protein PilM
VQDIRLAHLFLPLPQETRLWRSADAPAPRSSFWTKEIRLSGERGRVSESLGRWARVLTFGGRRAESEVILAVEPEADDGPDELEQPRRGRHLLGGRKSADPKFQDSTPPDDDDAVAADDEGEAEPWHRRVFGLVPRHEAAEREGAAGAEEPEPEAKKSFWKLELRFGRDRDEEEAPEELDAEPEPEPRRRRLFAAKPKPESEPDVESVLDAVPDEDPAEEPRRRRLFALRPQPDPEAAPDDESVPKKSFWSTEFRLGRRRDDEDVEVSEEPEPKRRRLFAAKPADEPLQDDEPEPRRRSLFGRKREPEPELWDEPATLADLDEPRKRRLFSRKPKSELDDLELLMPDLDLSESDAGEKKKKFWSKELRFGRRREQGEAADVDDFVLEVPEPDADVRPVPLPAPVPEPEPDLEPAATEQAPEPAEPEPEPDEPASPPPPPAATEEPSVTAVLAAASDPDEPASEPVEAEPPSDAAEEPAPTPVPARPVEVAEEPVPSTAAAPVALAAVRQEPEPQPERLPEPDETVAEERPKRFALGRRRRGQDDDGLPTERATRRRRPGQDAATPSRRGRSRGGGKKTIVGLKVGASQVAAAYVANNGSPELLQVAREPLEEGIVVGGELRDPEALAQALAAFFKKHKLPRRSVRLGLSSNRIGVRSFELSGIEDPKQLTNAVRFRAQDALPIPLNEAALDYHVLEEAVGEDGVTHRRVLLVVAYRDLVDRYVDACRKAGLKLIGVDLEAFAALRALAAPRPEEEKPGGALVVVSIGHDRATLAVSDGRVCEFTRVLDWGGSSLNVAIARALDMTPMEAEPIKRQLSLGKADAEIEGVAPDRAAKAREAAVDQLQGFARELVSSLHFYQSQPGSLEIAEVVLTGGGAHLAGLATELERLTGVRVRIGDPFIRVSVGKKLAPPQPVGSLAVAIGLGIED